MQEKLADTSWRARIALVVLALALGLVTLIGCNTWKGAGEDVEKAGESMQGD